MCFFGFDGSCAVSQILWGVYKEPAFAETLELMEAALCPLTLLCAVF